MYMSVHGERAGCVVLEWTAIQWPNRYTPEKKNAEKMHWLVNMFIGVLAIRYPQDGKDRQQNTWPKQ